MELAYALIAALGVSIISLVGVLIVPSKWNHRKEQRLLGFAAGVLLATATLQLIPEAVDHSAGMAPYYAVLGGVVGFFILERYMRGFHSHQQENRKTPGYMVIVGDGVHNFIDGVAIAAAFLVNPEVGAATTLAIAAHEIPQEIADFVVLIRSGFSRSRALLLNFASALTCLLGVLIGFGFGNVSADYEPIALAATAGVFLYIAAADIIPELNHAHPSGHKFSAPMLTGVILVAALTAVIPHH